MKQLWFLLLLLTLSGNSQNWNVFNKNYRYNYKFNNSPLISNVLFADTVKQTGADTAYIMNNIGVVTGSILTTNQPQFLEKKIIKLANGNVLLQTTNALTIVPTCTLNQTWLFDAINNYSASCVGTSTETVFSIVDSIKTILINNTDSMKLSKNFGLIQYPKLYAQNSYYRLAGIEDGTKYDTVSLFGERVPNAWDFYDYKIGQGLCTNYSYMYGGAPLIQGCSITQAVVVSKTITTSGYSYNMNKKTITTNYSSSCNPYTNNPFVNTIVNYLALTSKTLTENRMYPGMVMGDLMYPGLVSFVGSSQTITSKVKGPTTFSGSFIINNTYAATYTLTNMGGRYLSYRVGVGLEFEYNTGFEMLQSYSTGCGTLNIGVGENNRSTNPINIYPNPANSSITIPVDNCKLFIYDIFGKAILVETIENKRSLDVSDIPNGIYFIEIQTDSGKHSQKLIIQH